MLGALVLGFLSLSILSKTTMALLEIKSKLGQGSTFSVYLPALEEAPIV
jgi:signal transduction histidine kinase